MRKTLPSSVRLAVAGAQKWRCRICDALLPARFEIDHIRPVHRGGSDDIHNLQALCPACHSAKTNHEQLARLRQVSPHWPAWPAAPASRVTGLRRFAPKKM